MTDPSGKPSTRLRKFVEDGFSSFRAPLHHEHCRSCTSALHRTVVDSRRGLVSIWRVVVRPSHAGSFRRRQQSNFSNNSGQQNAAPRDRGFFFGSFVKLFALRIGAISACFRRRRFGNAKSRRRSVVTQLRRLPFGNTAAPSPSPLGTALSGSVWNICCARVYGSLRLRRVLPLRWCYSFSVR
jgi:hypothetical protein